VATSKELMEKGQIANIVIKCLVLRHSNAVSKMIATKKEYKDEIDYLIGSESRNKFIRNLAISLDGNTLILYQFVDNHGKALYNMIKDTKRLGDRKVFFIYGGVEATEREEVRQIVQNEKDAIIVASYGTFSTGINIPNIDNLILGSPSKSKIRNLQSIGRSLRLAEGKTHATLFDISDDMTHGKRMNHTLKHFLERVTIYNEEQFPFKIYKIGLKDDNETEKNIFTK
jgi:superfamily II DNA or RNA helicase